MYNNDSSESDEFSPDFENFLSEQENQMALFDQRTLANDQEINAILSESSSTYDNSKLHPFISQMNDVPIPELFNQKIDSFGKDSPTPKKKRKADQISQATENKEISSAIKKNKYSFFQLQDCSSSVKAKLSYNKQFYSNEVVYIEDEHNNPYGILKKAPLNTIYLYVPTLINIIMNAEEISESMLPQYKLPVVALKNKNNLTENIIDFSEINYINGLMLACYYGNMTNIKLLFRYHLTIDGNIDKNVLTQSFLFALKSPVLEEHELIEIFNLFTECNSKLDASISDHEGNSILHLLALNSDNRKTLIEIISKKLDINSSNFNILNQTSKSPFDIIMQEKDWKKSSIYKKFLCDIDLNLVNEFQKTIY